MKKKLLAITVALALSMCMAGCGNTKADADTGKGTTSATGETTGQENNSAGTETFPVTEDTNLPVADGGNESTTDVNQTPSTDGEFIGVEKAKELVLAHLGLTDATFHEAKYDMDDGVYDLEFVADGIEYDYEVDAVTGKILEVDRDKVDVHDDDDDDWDDLYEDRDDD